MVSTGRLYQSPVVFDALRRTGARGAHRVERALQRRSSWSLRAV